MDLEVLARLAALAAKIFEKYPNVTNFSVSWNNGTASISVTEPIGADQQTLSYNKSTPKP